MTIMRRLLVPLGLIVGLFCLTGNASAQIPPYGQSSFSGNWGFGLAGAVIKTPPPTGVTPNCNGWISVTDPVVVDGLLSGDGKGNVSGTQTVNAAGTICSYTLAGTYTVNPDGTGTLTNIIATPVAGSSAQCIAAVAGISFSFSFAFGNGVNHLDLAETDCFEVTSGSATKQ
jgi:hypothetical protein